MSDLPNYTRKVPGEWAGLQAIATEIAPPDLPYDQISVSDLRIMREHVEQYPNSRLAVLHYYGLRVGMRPFARELSDTQTRHRLIEAGAASLAASYRSQMPTTGVEPGLRIHQLGPTLTKTAMVSLATETASPLDTPVRLLTHTLSAITWARRCKKQGQIPDEQHIMREISSGTLVGEEIGTVATAGAFTVMRSGLFLRARRDGISPNAPIHRIVDEAALRSHVSPKTAAGFATLPLGTILDDMRRMGHVSLDEQGNVAFLREDPLRDHIYPTSEPWPVLHTGALGCPALHVAGLIRSAAEMIPEMIIKADQSILDAS